MANHASRLASLLAVVALAAMAVPVAANHVQSDTGNAIAFDHVTGNEWWVEVALGGQGAGSVVQVEAMDTNGPWVTLQKKSWGPYAASFHIEPGNQVRFRATWSGGAQQASCWFTHPAGAEQCATPPAGWTVNAVGDAASQPAGRDLAVGDVDGDGRNEVYLAAANGLWRFEWTSAGWTRTPVNQWGAFQQVAVGDLSGDGRPELYAARAAGFEGRADVASYQWDGAQWEEFGFFITGPDTTIGAMAVGDVEDDGLPDLYFGGTQDGAIVMQYELEGPNQGFMLRHAMPVQFGMTALAVGDADNDGDLDLYAGSRNGDLNRLDFTEGGGEGTLLGNTGPSPIQELAVGDPDGDGVRELYAASNRLTSTTGGAAQPWPMTQLPVGGLWSPMSVAVADADNSGGPELLVAGNDGGLYRYTRSGGAWSFANLATAPVRGLVGMAVADGDGDGLREAYLAGPPVTCCSTPASNPVVQVTDHAVPARPPPAWDESLVGDAGGRSGESDIAIGDGDRDGKREVYVAAREGLYQFDWTGATWQRTVLSANSFHRVAVGDGDRDGRVDVYASGFGLNGGYEVVRFTADGAGGWASSQVHASTVPVGSMTIGDVDDDGTSELYIAMMPEFGDATQSVPSYQLEFEGGGWQVRYITNLVGGVRSSWIGDGDRDGDRDWYVLGEAAYKLDITPTGAASSQLIGGDLAGEDNWFNGIVAADGDRDGRPEVYVGASRFHAATDAIYRYSWSGSAWTRTVIALPQQVGPRDLAFGDADNDGQSEVWFSSRDGALYRLASSGGAWGVKAFADVGDEMGIDLAVGDADGDGKAEAYMTAYDTSRAPPENVYRLGTVPPPASFDATFTAVRGNEWWIQANVAASGGTLSKVDVRLNGGAWQPLTLQSWGGWAASYRAVQGTVVQLRATATGGAMDLSACYQWIPASNLDAAVVACTGQPPPPGFDATFTGVSGNAWWVQANVAANQPIGGVEARVNCALPWHTLTKQSWGGWAASFNVPAGSKVDFRARSTSSGTDLSGGYIWPNATPTSGC